MFLPEYPSTVLSPDRLKRYQLSVTESKMTEVTASGDDAYHPSEPLFVAICSLFKGLNFRFAYEKADPAALPLPTILKTAI
jgi:hypothetical protein